ncbi:potassium-transporting ATPase subunit B, partial [Proteus mirabilis]|nr:potassium-transporting ATPase subunit B [Proteus mirabilis]
FIVYVGALFTTGIWFAVLLGYLQPDNHFTFQVMLWLWITLLFDNFAESLAESRSKAQAASLRGAKQKTQAVRLEHADLHAP